MNIRVIKKRCAVKGCRNTESFAISRSESEIGNIIICASCLAEALSSVDEARQAYKTKAVEKRNTVPPQLFFHPTTTVKADAETAADVEYVSDSDSGDNESAEYICTFCGREFKTERGLKLHLNTHEGE